MKKYRHLLTLLTIMVLTISCSTNAFATITARYLEFERKAVGSSEIYVSKFLPEYFSPDQTLEIPSTIQLDTDEECEVVAIGRNVFQGCTAKNVEICSTVRVISGYAFQGATIKGDFFEELNGDAGCITIANGVLQIGAYAFADVTCRSIKIANSVSVIQERAFSNISLKSFELPTSLRTMERAAFPDSSDVTIIVPKELTNFDRINLSDYQYTVFQIPEDASTSVEQVFKNCGVHYKRGENGIVHTPNQETTTPPKQESTPTSPKEPNSKQKTAKVGKIYTIDNLNYKVTSKNTVTFTGCKKKTVTTLSIPKKVTIYNQKFNVTKVTAKACKGYKKLKKVTVGNHVRTVENEAFAYCPKLEYITFGTNVKYFKKNVWYQDTNLKRITVLSKKVKSFGIITDFPTKKKYGIKPPSGYKKKYEKMIIKSYRKNNKKTK